MYSGSAIVQLIRVHARICASLGGYIESEHTAQFSTQDLNFYLLAGKFDGVPVSPVIKPMYLFLQTPALFLNVVSELLQIFNSIGGLDA